MKSITYIIVVILIVAGSLVAQSNFHNIHYLDPYNPEYVKGEVLVKFKDEVQVETSFKSGIAKTGLSSVDKVLEPYQTEAIVKVFKETRDQRSRKTVKTIRDFKGNEIEVPALFNIYKLSFDTIWNVEQIVEELSKDSSIEFAEPNYLIYTTEVLEKGEIIEIEPELLPNPIPYNPPIRNTIPDDPLYGQQWYLPAINAPAAWDSVTGDTTQIIAIIDTGVDWDHPDLDDNIWTNWNEIPDNGIDDDNNGYIDDTRGWDYINNDNDPNDDNSHGTHVAGIAAAEGNNGIGICGVAWNASIMPVKMLQSSGTGNSSDLASAIEYASDNGATVINMSLGSYGESGTVKSALYNAYINSLLVAAAGNNALNLDAHSPPFAYTAHFPACYPFVLGVAASKEVASSCCFNCPPTIRACWSNYDPSGPMVYGNKERGYFHNYEIMAPGEAIISSIPNGSYRTYNGTSMAAPIVSGICALYKSYNDTIPNDFLWAKLIFGSDNNDVVNAYNTLTLDLNAIDPDLRFIEYTLTDTLPGCDGDGRADAGETIQIHFTVKNVGGYADSAWVKVRFSEFEDTTTAVITDSTSYIGDLSTWATLTSELSPLEIKIDSNVAHNRDIVFEYEIGCGNSTNRIINDLIIGIENGEELTGMLGDTLVLTSDKLWLITGSFRITTAGCLIILPGTELIIDSKLINDGSIIGIGTKDSLIIINGTTIRGSGGYLSLKYANINLSYNDIIIDGQRGILEFCKLELNGYRGLGANTHFRINDCVFRNWIVGQPIVGNDTLFRCNIDNISSVLFTDDPILIYNNINRYNSLNINAWTAGHPVFIGKNNILDSYKKICYNSNYYGYYHEVPNQYWGTSDSSHIEDKIYDFIENAEFSRIVFSPYLEVPTDSAHGCVWKVEINEVDPQDEIFNPIGSGTYQFDVYFNKCMDTSYTPLLGFGVVEPYLQRLVINNSSWSGDSSIWTAYYEITPETGDGINTIRVQDAVDTAGFIIPVENQRFQFVIQAASAASVQFYATAGIGKVELEWPPTSTDDALGYNLYRSYNLTDSTYSDTLMINTELILDTVYTDYNVIPDTTYHYLYKTLGTDMVETDYSKKVTATPFDAANGDANGDLAVNVLDITTIVSYMLNQSPSPFLFDAADVNYDNEINVLDIIGLVQLINGKKALSTKPLPEISNETAYYYFDDNKVGFESEGNVAALQFKLKVRSRKLGVGSQESELLENLKIFSLAQGFEFAYSVVGDEIIGILYSLSGREIPEGISELFRFEGIDTGNLEISDIFGGDLKGNYVPILKKGTSSNVFSTDAELQASPNPFTFSTQINYTVPENGIVEIKLFDISGSEISKLENTFHNAGKHSIIWNGTNNVDQLLKSGIYLIQLRVRSVSGNSYNKEIKVVLTK